MHAVIVDSDLAYPATSGKRLRTLHLMLRLARRHQITYLCRCDERGEQAERASQYLTEQGIETILIPEPIPKKSGPLFYARLAANLLSPVPYTVMARGNRRVAQEMRAYAARRQVDIWQFEWPAYADYLAGLPGVRTVINAHNVESLVWHRYFLTERNPLKRWYIKQQWHKYEAFERRLFAAATRVATCSAADARILREFGVYSADVVENGVDTTFFQPDAHAERDPQQIIFLGALDYRPNTQAVDVLLGSVFPEVRARQPDARLCIVGRHASAALERRVQSLNGVELHTNVADVRPFLGRSAVMAVPLQVGGGSRLKILEALAAGLPVVSTRVGAEGLDLTDGAEIDVVERVEQMADALVDALRQPERMRAMAERGTRVVREHYDWDVVADKLEETWQRCQTAGLTLTVDS